jgi:hypothetical protein
MQLNGVEERAGYRETGDRPNVFQFSPTLIEWLSV